MKTCPDRGRLEQLLNNRLVDTELDELEQHVEGCADCQQTLDELSDATNCGLAPGCEVLVTRDGGESGRDADPVGLTARAAPTADTRMGRGLPTVAGYEIEVELGRGGMGVVYRARHLRLNRPCALKMILAGLHAGPDVVARFVTEAEAIARLEHPSIVQIRHIGDADGLPFFELEYVSGGSLDQQLDGTPARQAGRSPCRTSGNGDRRSPSARYRSSRSQTLERAFGGRRHTQSRRLRPGENTGQPVGVDSERVGHGLAQLHGARAGPGAGETGRHSRGCLRGGGDPL